MLKGIFGLVIAAAAMSGSTQFVLADKYPTRPVRVITLTAPGGSLDILARVVAQNLSDTLGQQFYVENKVGAGGNLGVAELARAAPDGYTIGMITVSTHGINPSLFGSKLPFDAQKDFELLGVLAELKNVVVVNPSLPVNSIPDLVAYAKANPGKLSFGSAGVGTSQHMAGELFKQLAGIDMNHVPYRGAAQAAPDLVSGQIQLMFSSIPDVIGFVRGGQLRAIAVSTQLRSPVFPDVKPVAEQGFPNFNVRAWFGLAAPKGTPPEIVVLLNKNISAALAKPEVREKLAAIGMDRMEPMTAAEMKAFVKREIDQWAEVVKAAKIELPQ